MDFPLLSTLTWLPIFGGLAVLLAIRPAEGTKILHALHPIDFARDRLDRYS